MHSWIIEPEYISCIVLAILFVYASLQRFAFSPKQTAFRCSLLITITAIVANIGSVHCIEDPYRFPMWLNYSASAWYFALTLMMVGSISIAGLMLVYEDRYDLRGFRRAVLLHVAMYTLALLIILSNEYTKLLFYFDANDMYTRGPLNAILLPFTLVCIAVNLICFINQRKNVHHSFMRILFALPAIGILFGLTQMLSPYVMLTGSAATIALLVLFINGQLQRLNADQLTDLGTRELFYRLIERNVARGRPFHIIIISIRSYKDVNNRFGQRGGDACLRSIGEFLQHLNGVEACRFTGVEFAVVTRIQDDLEYEAMYSALRERFSQPWLAGSIEVTLSAAFADIAYPEPVSDINEMITSLEYATRLAKQQGSGASVRFDKALKSVFGRRNYIIELLHTAIQDSRFYLNFQPIYDCRADCLNGAEALVRLREDNGNPISPGEFMPLAEDTGDVVDIGWFVMESVLSFLAAHSELPLKWVSVNISAQQYQSPQFVERIAALMQRYLVGPSVLKLEITERVLLEDIDRARSIMCALKNIGVGTGLDDFGTGYSNLANVMSLPFEVVKIDKSYIDDIVTNRRAFSLLETIITAVRALDMLVLVEGVETQEQFKLMEWLQVDNVQGYYFSKPLEEAQFIETIQKQDRQLKSADPV